jgi:hypothetical protein
MGDNKLSNTGWAGQLTRYLLAIMFTVLAVFAPVNRACAAMLCR